MEQRVTRPVLASTEVSYAGEPVAFVVADTRYEAEDALELIEVSYEALPSYRRSGRGDEGRCA